MALARKLTYNTLYQVIGRIVFTLLSAVSVIVLTRYLGQSLYGDYTTISVFVMFFVTWADIGVSVIAVREMAKDEEKMQAMSARILSLRFFLSMIFCALAVIVGLLLPYSHHIKLGIIISTAAIFFTLMNGVWSMIFQTKLAMEYAAIPMMIGRAVVVGLILLMVYLHAGFLWIVSASFFGALTDYLISTGFVRKFIKIRWKIDWQFWKRVLILSLPIGLVTVINSVYFRVDIIILSLIKSSADVGIYGVAYKFLEIVLAFPGFVVVSIFPILSARIFRDDLGAKTVMQQTFDVLLILALPIVAGTYLLAEPIVGIVGGAQFFQSVVPLQILAFAMGLFFFDNFLSQVIVILNQQKMLIKLAIFSLAINLVLNLIFIPKYSYIGAAWVTVITQVVVLFLMLFLIRRHYQFLPNLRKLPKILLSTVLMIILILLMKPLLALNHYYVVAIFLAALVLYLGLVVLLRTISWQTVKSLLPSGIFNREKN